MGCNRVAGLLLVILIGFLGSSQAYKFLVGGRDGWVLNPCENYSHWAERNRFQVNDTLFFKYKKGSDSVLVVSKDDYYACNAKSPLRSLTDGDSVFKFDRSGPFFFISGNGDRCNKGQKLIVVVLAVRHKTFPPQPAPTAAPPSVSPSPESPPAVPSSPPPALSPTVGPPDSNAPAPAPSHESGSVSLASSVGLALGMSLGVSVVLGI